MSREAPAAANGSAKAVAKLAGRAAKASRSIKITMTLEVVKLDGRKDDI